MANQFEPNLSTLPAGQRLLWDELREIPANFVLCGGTAIALQLGHRVSLDFDFISSESFDPDALYRSVSFLNGSKTIQKSANTLTCVVGRGAPVQISFFGTPSVRLVEWPLIAADNGVQVASLVDLSGMKAAVVQKRAEARDYIDLDAILTQGGIGLPLALAAARELYGLAFNPQLTLKSLCFFGDGNLKSIPREMQDRLAAAVNAVDLNQLPKMMRRPS
jgi:Nucleotidyl transferase AbiEii toxin, Type IV TA system